MDVVEIYDLEPGEPRPTVSTGDFQDMDEVEVGGGACSQHRRDWDD